nr:4Fe-4S single cluster domain-containing protein [Intrasporangium calvum]
MAASLTSDRTLRLGAVVPRTRAEGPGERFAVWVQGCSVRCSGCFNPHLWGPSLGQEVRVADLVADAVSAGVEGVTLLGGEPFDQAPGAAEFATGVREAGLSVMTFTGFVREYLEGPKSPDGADRLLAATDLLVDGPYLADRRDPHRPWVGSTNQRFHFITDRYRDLRLDVLPDRLEVRVGKDGEIAINGWAGVDQLDALLADVAGSVGRGRVR